MLSALTIGLREIPSRSASVPLEGRRNPTRKRRSGFARRYVRQHLADLIAGPCRERKRQA
jgi:hypothetical protein